MLLVKGEVLCSKSLSQYTLDTGSNSDALTRRLAHERQDDTLERLLFEATAGESRPISTLLMYS